MFFQVTWMMTQVLKPCVEVKSWDHQTRSDASVVALWQVVFPNPIKACFIAHLLAKYLFGYKCYNTFSLTRSTSYWWWVTSKWPLPQTWTCQGGRAEHGTNRTLDDTRHRFGKGDGGRKNCCITLCKFRSSLTINLFRPYLLWLSALLSSNMELDADLSTFSKAS